MELQRPGAVKVMLPAGATTATACVYVPGSDIAARVTGAGDSVVLDSVPAGKLPSVNYLPENDAQSSVIRYDVQILSGDTVALLNPSWRYARSITLNTTPSGADVRGNVTGFPALIRLTHDNFDFSQAQLGGGDLMFTKPDNTPLPHEIERFDPAAEHAEVWVRIDTVYGNNSAQSIMLYWGASASSATVASNSAAVFDTAASKGGFQGVWHMNGAGNATAYDATGNHYNGVPYGMTASSSVPGAIGLSRQFDGTSSYFVMPNTASSSLNLPENGNYTVSAWANSNFLDARYQGIVYKSNWQYGLQIHSDSTWEFFEYKDGQGWESTMNPATAGSWYNITGVRQGVHQYLYVNGVCVDSIITFGSITNPRITNMDLQIGHCQDGGLEPDRFFNGKIDEVRIANVALNADWIKLCYMNQRADDKLVVFK
jgi:biopolymer transport protein ExbB